MHGSFSPDLKSKTLAALLVLATTLRFICAQEHLESAPKLLSDHDEYYAKVRELLADAYRADVVLRVVMAISFQPEEVAGIRRTSAGYEVFDLKPATAIWDTLSL